MAVSKINAGVVDSNPTLEFGATSQVGKINGAPLRVTMPADPVDEMFIIKRYCRQYTIAAGATLQLKANTFYEEGTEDAPVYISTPDGYTPIAIVKFTTGRIYCVPASIDAAALGDTNLVTILNTNSVEETDRWCRVNILYAKLGTVAGT